MGTVIRSELSRKNEYHIEKHRYYELKHHCLQYQSWKKALGLLSVYPTSKVDRVRVGTTDPTLNLVEKRIQYIDKIELLDRVAMEADPIIGPCVLQGVTTGMSYEVLKTHINIPCGKDLYYAIYRKFFWLLDKVKD